MTTTAEARIPTLHVTGDCIPQAYFRAIKAVWENGYAIRTEYDRKNGAGAYIDPPSRDARVLIEVKDPFAQPRFPPHLLLRNRGLYRRDYGRQGFPRRAI